VSAETAVVHFDLGPLGASATKLTPTLNGVSLCDLLTEFEAAEVFDVVGGYDGLVLDYFSFGDLGEYLLGQGGPRRKRGVVPLLGCDCGEWGLLSTTGQGDCCSRSRALGPLRAAPSSEEGP